MRTTPSPQSSTHTHTCTHTRTHTRTHIRTHIDMHMHMLTHTLSLSPSPHLPLFTSYTPPLSFPLCSGRDWNAGCRLRVRM